MAKKRAFELHFPVGGLDRRGPYKQQSPYTTPDALNVRPFGPLEGRERGGSRPGLAKSHEDQLDTGPVRMLASMDYVADGTGLTTWTESFDGTSLSEAWSQALWNSNKPAVLSSKQDDLAYTVNSCAAVANALLIDNGETYRIEMFISPYEGTYSGKYRIYARLDGTDPNILDDGITAELVMEDDTGAYSGSLTVTVAGVDTAYAFTAGTDSAPIAGWFAVEIDGDTVTCYWRGTQLVTQAITSQAEVRFGFGLECTQGGSACVVDEYQVQYVSTSGGVELQQLLVGSAGGDLYKETFKRNMAVVTSALSLRSDVPLSAAQIGQKLYIGDYDNSTGKYPKVYDPSANTMTNLTASAGTIPRGCPLLCRYRNRLVVAGEESLPHVWYMARQGDPTDWDYAEEDAQAAVSGVLSDTGVPGEPITALAPYSDDYLILGCIASLWIIRGDPMAGGVLDNLSPKIGIITADAWTIGPSGELVMLTHDGLYVLPPGGTSFPVSVSRERIPQELLHIDPLMKDVFLEYDVLGRGVHIFLTPKSTSATYHWWFDWERKTFWPVTMDNDYEPTAIHRHTSAVADESGVILGCRDGYLRRFSMLNDSDDGTAFSSYVKLGPVPIGNGFVDGKIDELACALANDSGDVTWSISTGHTPESALYGTTVDSGTFKAGEGYSVRPAGRGQSFVLTLTGAGSRWATEWLSAITKQGGRRKLQ